jgi:hypothetical protein
VELNLKVSLQRVKRLGNGPLDYVMRPGLQTIPNLMASKILSSIPEVPSSSSTKPLILLPPTFLTSPPTTGQANSKPSRDLDEDDNGDDESEEDDEDDEEYDNEEIEGENAEEAAAAGEKMNDEESDEGEGAESKKDNPKAKHLTMFEAKKDCLMRKDILDSSLGQLIA